MHIDMLIHLWMCFKPFLSRLQGDVVEHSRNWKHTHGGKCFHDALARGLQGVGRYVQGHVDDLNALPKSGGKQEMSLASVSCTKFDHAKTPCTATRGCDYVVGMRF